MAFSRILQDLLEQDRFAKFTKTSNTTATLGSLTLNTAILGAGGLDTGSIAASTFYYVYTIVDSNSIKLIASISPTSPTGFTQYKKVGAFYTDTSSNIFKAYFYGEIATLSYGARINTAGVISDESSDWISGNAANVAAGRWTVTINSAIFSVSPLVVGTIDSETLAGWDIVCRVVELSTTTFRIYTTANGPSGGLNNYDAQFIATKRGIDAVQPDWSRI
jgi:hypothetical protein